jgi:hypothetical protein
MKAQYRSLFEGAAAACLAAFHGKRELWETAISDAASVNAAALDCWFGDVNEFLQGAVSAYQSNSGTRFERGAPLASRCPRLLTVSPTHGPRNGGYSVLITGANLPQSLEIAFYGDHPSVTATRTADGQMTFVMPPAAQDEESIQFFPAGQPRGLGPLLAVDYDNAPTSSPPPSSPSTSTSPSTPHTASPSPSGSAQSQ